MYVKISNEEAQTIRSLGHDAPFGWCPVNGLVLNLRRLDPDMLAAAAALLECGKESRNTVSATFIGDYVSEIEGIFDCPDDVPTLTDFVHKRETRVA